EACLAPGQMPALKPSTRNRLPSAGGHRALIDPIVSACAWMQHCRKDAAVLPEPEWYAMPSTIGGSQNGEELARAGRRPDPNHTDRETAKKMEHALTAAGPVTCARVEELTGGEWCQNCELRGMITSPIVVGNPEEVAKQESLKVASEAVRSASDDPARVFEQEVIGALAVLKKEEPAEYARLKQELKGKVNLNALERAVNKKIAERRKMRLVETSEPPAPLSEILPDLPIELRKPYNWTVNENGIWLSKGNKKEPVCACPVPVILTKRLRNIETSQEKVEIAFYRDQKWRYIMADRATVFNRTSLIQLTNKGLPVSSESAR